MSLYKRENVPEIPMSPSLPNLPLTRKDLQELPSFPTGNRNNNINQEIVKSAISDNPGEDEVRIKSPEEELGKINLPTLPFIPTAPKGKVSIMDEDESLRIPKLLVNKTSSFLKNNDAEPIFVRIDKFQLAKKSVEQIKKRIDEMESVVEKLNEVKVKEEEEIKLWSSEISNLKIKLSEIDSNIFDQI